MASLPIMEKGMAGWGRALHKNVCDCKSQSAHLLSERFLWSISSRMMGPQLSGLTTKTGTLMTLSAARVTEAMGCSEASFSLPMMTRSVGSLRVIHCHQVNHRLVVSESPRACWRSSRDSAANDKVCCCKRPSPHDILGQSADCCV